MTTAKVTLVLDSATADGTLFARGSARIFPSARIPDTADELLIEAVPVRVAFTGSGAPSVQLYPNDLIGPQNDDGTPGWTYTVYYDGCPGSPQPWSFVLLSTDSDEEGEQRLSGLAEVPAATASFPYLPTPTGTPSAGDVPIATGAGEATAWGSPGEASTGYPLEPVVSGTPATGQVLTATDATHAHWAAPASAPVTSVNSKTGVVTLTASDVGADASGAAAAAQAAAEAASVPLSDLPLSLSNGGTGATSAAAARTALGLGTAATHASTDFDSAGAASSALAAAEAYTDAETTRAEAAEGTLTTAVGGKVAKAGDTMTGKLAPKVVTLTDASTVLVDASLGNDFRLLTTSGIGSTRAIGAPSSPADGQVITLDVQQDGSGSRLVTWASGTGGYSFGTDGAPTLTTTAGAVDTIGFRYHGALGKWICVGWKLGFS